MKANFPTRTPDILTSALDSETIVYDPQGKVVHVLNDTAKLIWLLCDGNHSAADLEAALRQTFDVPEEANVAKDVQATLVTLEEKGLIVYPEKG
jgi:hypothetical protein